MCCNKQAGSWKFNSRPFYGFQDRLPPDLFAVNVQSGRNDSLVTDNCLARSFDDFRFSFASRFRSASAKPTLLGQQKASQKKFRKSRERHRFQCPPKITARLFVPHNVSRQIAAILLSLSQVISILRHFDSDVFVFRPRRPSAVVMDRFYLRCAQSRAMKLHSALIGWLLLAVFIAPHHVIMSWRRWLAFITFN